MEFKVGDVVCLKGSTQTITIQHIDIEENLAECVWIDKDGKPHQQEFLFATLISNNPTSTLDKLA